DIIAYKTVLATDGDNIVLDKLKDGEVDIVTFTSASTVKNFVKIIGEDNLSTFKDNVQFASIGPITNESAEEMNIDISIKAEEYTIPGLVQAIVEKVNQ
ncbi:MAG: uroporphyrinogen-III synthase, partial [Candidatus Scalindua sp.]|nr:uroporphyrinogen-III synthase [Candidatus Scalindua sp.]